MLQSLTAHRPEIHGHRGCRGLLPENTIPAFLHALALGVDVLEMDVVISSDHQVVVSHEPWLNPSICLGPDGRILGTDSASRFNIYHMSYHLIRQCDCGLLGHPDFPTQQPQAAYKPLLKEVFAAVEYAVKHLGRAPVRFSIEIKCTPEGDGLFHPMPSIFLPLVIAELTAARVISKTTLLSFDLRILQLAHRQQPALATCLLVEQNQPWLASLQALGFVPTAFGPDFRSVTSETVQHLRTAFPSLRLVPWTVNEPADMQNLIDWQVDGITTDFPSILSALLRY